MGEGTDTANNSCPHGHGTCQEILGFPNGPGSKFLMVLLIPESQGDGILEMKIRRGMWDIGVAKTKLEVDNTDSVGPMRAWNMGVFARMAWKEESAHCHAGIGDVSLGSSPCF
jgi:hypothetical protein